MVHFGQTGFTPLSCAENFGQWLRSFRAAAGKKGLWGLFTGEIETVDEPHLVNLVHKAKRSKKPPSDESNFNTQLRILQTQMMIEKFNRNQVKVEQAWDLLREHVSIHICKQINRFDSPKEAFKEIVEIYELDDEEEILERALQDLQDLRLNNRPIDKFMDEAKALRDDFQDVGEVDADMTVFRRVLDLLATRYEAVAHHYAHHHVCVRSMCLERLHEYLISEETSSEKQETAAKQNTAKPEPTKVKKHTKPKKANQPQPTQLAVIVVA